MISQMTPVPVPIHVELAIELFWGQVCGTVETRQHAEPLFSMVVARRPLTPRQWAPTQRYDCEGNLPHGNCNWIGRRSRSRADRLPPFFSDSEE